MIEAKINYDQRKTTTTLKANLNTWLEKMSVFHLATEAHFTGMLLSTINYDSDHIIYVLAPPGVFRTEKEKETRNGRKNGLDSSKIRSDSVAVPRTDSQDF